MQFGEKQKIVLVRLLNSTVMVRVGGGWVPLEEFVLNNDPCKGKHLSNIFAINTYSLKKVSHVL